MSLAKSPLDKSVVVQFIGGPRDGEEYQSNSDRAADRRMACFVWDATGGGRIGNNFRFPSPAGLEMHRFDGNRLQPLRPTQVPEYEVVKVVPTAREIVLRMKYAGCELAAS